jgi:hypothetical protein
MTHVPDRNLIVSETLRWLDECLGAVETSAARPAR